MLRLTLDTTITIDMVNELQSLMYGNERLPKPKLVTDGNRYRYRFDIKTKHIEFFRKKFTEYKLQNSVIDIFHEEIQESIPNKIIQFLNLKNFIFPIKVTIRYTLDENTDAKSYREYLISYFPDEEFPEATFIGDEKFKRFKIEFQIKNTELFDSNFSRFREENENDDIYLEYDKKTLRSYITLIAYIGAILFAITRAWEFYMWFESLPK